MKRGRGMVGRLAGFLALVLMALPALADSPPPGTIITEHLMVGVSGDAEIYVRNKHVVELSTPDAQHTVIFVHGASYPGHTTFDMNLPGGSWMDWLAKRGFDVYAVDLRGYGRSTRPPEMNQPPEANKPVVDTAQAVKDLAYAVQYVLSRRNLTSLSLVGWSWGATVAGRYTTDEAYGRVNRLVLYAPQWLRDNAAPAEVAPGQVGAWRTVYPREARERWLKGVPAAKRDDIMPKEWFDSWVAETLGGKSDLQAPNGVVADAISGWAAGKPLWRPDRLSVPTLVVQGEWDGESPPEMGRAVFAQLKGNKRYVVIGEATHAMLLEKNRQQLFRAVQSFLEEPF
ncbi:MAG: alpha/beta hydrolase [Actinomycetota bacterium]